MLQDYKITELQITQQGVIAAPDKMRGTAEENKMVFDRLTSGAVRDGLNGLIDALDGPGGANEIGVEEIHGMPGTTVQAALQSARDGIATKVDHVPGKGLSTEDYTTTDRNKLAGIEPNANKYTLPVATVATLGGVKQGVGVEILSDGTLNGLAAPAPDFEAREAIADHANNGDIHTTPGEKLIAATITYTSGTFDVTADIPAPQTRATVLGYTTQPYAMGDIVTVNGIPVELTDLTGEPLSDGAWGNDSGLAVPVQLMVDLGAGRAFFNVGGGAGGIPAFASKVTITVVGSLPVGVGNTRVVVRNERLGLYMSLPLDANDQAIFDLISGLKYHLYLENYPEGYYGGDVTIFPNAGEEISETIDMLTTPDIVGVYVNQTAKTLTYTDGNIDFTPAKMTIDGWDWGDWLNSWIVTGTRQCLLKNGVVQYYLDPNDYTKKRDGTPADITSGADGDVMVEFPRCYIKIITDTNGYQVSFSRTKIDETWTANAFLNRDGVPMPYMYTAAYDGFELDGKLRSISGKVPTVNKTIGAFRTLATANGLGYEQQEWLKRCYLQMLFMLLTKTTDSQAVVGKGITAAQAAIPTGTMNDKGLCWGDQTGTNGVKFLGIENLWGNISKFCDGFINNAGSARVKLYAPYNDTASGYTNEGSIPTTSNFINTMSVSASKGLMPSALQADEPTSLYRDRMYSAASDVNICHAGGTWSHAVYAGVFCVFVSGAALHSGISLGSALSYTPQ